MGHLTATSSLPSTFFARCSQSLWDLVSDFSSVTDGDTTCASPCLLRCHSLDTSSRRTTECHTVFSAPILPRPVLSSHCGACLSKVRWPFFAAQLGLAAATFLLSTPHARTWLPISSDWTILACFNSIFLTSCGQTPPMSTATCPSNTKVFHCGH